MSEEISHDRRGFLGAAAMIIAAAQLGINGCVMQQLTRAEVQLPIEGKLPVLGSVTEWLNSQPLMAAGLRGKVALVQFWTYTCINWLRTLPYVRAWAEKYKDQGLVVIGVHTPEFAFEKDVVNVRRAAKDFWTMKKQFTALNQANGRIAYRFHARDLHLVMGPAGRGTSVRFRVLIDGQPPGAAHGIDVDDQGNGAVTEQRLYQLIRQPKPITDRQFEIEFLDSGVEAFAFTFG